MECCSLASAHTPWYTHPCSVHTLATCVLKCELHECGCTSDAVCMHCVVTESKLVTTHTYAHTRTHTQTNTRRHTHAYTEASARYGSAHQALCTLLSSLYTRVSRDTDSAPQQTVCTNNDGVCMHRVVAMLQFSITRQWRPRHGASGKCACTDTVTHAHTYTYTKHLILATK